MIADLLATTPSLPSGTMSGLMAALIFGAALFLLYLLPKYQWLIAGLIVIAITPLAIGGFLSSDNALGISDWDYYFGYHHVLRQSIVAYHTFPLWNPYTCGGTAALADPEFPVMTVTFPLELLFGVEQGFHFAIMLSVATTALGMLVLAKILRFSVWAALVAALGGAFGSVNVLEIVEGHQNILAAMWIPWILWSWLSAYQVTDNMKKRWAYIIACAIFLALTFYAGGIYLLMYVATAFIGFNIVAKRHRDAFTVTAVAGVLALGLAAFKLIPVFLWLSEFQDKMYASSNFTLTSLHKIFFGRYLHGGEDIIPNQGSGWHEYGAYIGPIIGVLALVGIAKLKKSRLVRLLIISVVIAVLISSSGPLLKPFFDQASFLPRSNISRYILFAVIPLSLLAGIGIDTIRRFKYRSIITHAFLLVIAIDLMTLSYPLSQQAFVLPYNEKPVPPAPLPIAYTAFTYETRHQGVDYTRAYEAVKVGYGSMSYCSVLTPTPAIRTIHDEVDKDILSVKTADEEMGTFDLKLWNPNTVIANVTLPKDGTVVLNANYAKGWYTNGQPAKNFAGRVGTKLSAGTNEVTFEYKTPGLIAGVMISLLTIGIVALVTVRVGKK
jgi:uncharacterized membrane protein YfhO